MKLELGSFPIDKIQFGASTAWTDGVLSIDADELIQLLSSDPAIEDVQLEIAEPGESARIIHLLDAIEPRIKMEGGGVAFPGQLGPVDIVGGGRTHRLSGMSVLISSEIPWKALGGLLMVREGIVDMQGEGSAYSPFSQTRNLVVVVKGADEFEDDDYEKSVRMAAVKTARYLAETVRHQSPPQLDLFHLPKPEPTLPRVAYICQIQSQGIWARTFFYGYPLDQLLPALIHPNELMDGALVSGNHVYQNFKIPTWLHCNNPVVESLYKRHGREIDFAGVILTRGHFYTNEEKQLSANLTARLASMIGAQGVIVSWEGGGNSAIDAMKTVHACEVLGIRTSLLAYELAGPKGDQYPLLFAVPEATGIVSTGSSDEPVSLPPVERCIGGDTIRIKPEIGGLRLAARQQLDLEMGHELYCGANQLGATRLCAREY